LLLAIAEQGELVPRPALLDFLQLFHSDSVVIAPHGFFGANQRRQGQHAAPTARHIHFDALLGYLIEAS